jgi:hypothetical protein
LPPSEDDQNNSTVNIDYRANNKLRRFPTPAKMQEKILREKVSQQIERIFFGIKRDQLYFVVKWFHWLSKTIPSINMFASVRYKVKTGCAYRNDE